MDKQAGRDYSLEDLGRESRFTDGAGREWLIRVFTLGGLGRFYALLARAWMKPSGAGWVRFFQSVLRHPEPGFAVRARRLLGLPDFSAGRIARRLTAVDARELRDRVMRANLDMGYDEFAAACLESLKKKSARNGTDGAKPRA